MQIRIKVGEHAETAGWTVVKLFALATVIVALISSSSRGLGRAPAGKGPKTVLPAVIRAARVDTIAVAFPAVVAKILVAPGATVKAGDAVAVLESEDVERQLASARRRVAIASRKPLRAAGRLAELQMRSAQRSLDLARRRLAEFSLGDAEAGLETAKARREKIAALARRHMATAAEVDAAHKEELNELRNLKAAREHESRLRQEVEAAELQVALLEAQRDPAPDNSAQAAELADARAALKAALRQKSELQVKAPNAGVALNSMLSPGDRVFAGTPILHIADDSRLIFEAAVSATLARAIHSGDAVRLRIPTDPPRQVDAQVSTVALAPDPAQQSYVVRAVIANPDRNAILVGMEGAIEFPHPEKAWRRPF